MVEPIYNKYQFLGIESGTFWKTPPLDMVQHENWTPRHGVIRGPQGSQNIAPSIIPKFWGCPPNEDLKLGPLGGGVVTFGANTLNGPKRCI